MKPIFVLSVVTSSLIAGFLGASVYAAFAAKRGDAQARTEREAQPRDAALPAPREASTEVAQDPARIERIEEVAEQVARLEIQVASLREELARREAPEPAALVAGPVGTEVAGSVDREAIVQVLEEQREKERVQREEERKKREREAIDRLAERTAKDLGLAPADQTRLSEFMVVASTKRDELFAAARAGGPEDFRKTFEEYRTWRDTEVKRTFGDQLGQQLIDHQRQARDGWMGGFGGGADGRDGRGGSDARDDDRRSRFGGRDN